MLPIQYPDGVVTLDDTHIAHATTLVNDANQHGYRVVAVAYKTLTTTDTRYDVSTEADLVLCGLLSFLDPPKASAKEAVQALADLAIHIKILTGDSDVITAHICAQVGIPTSHVLRGQDIAQMDDATFAQVVEESHIFAKLSPDQKERIIRTLQHNGHVVGFMGDGINDAPALRRADVGISVDSAVDIAKESSDIILLDPSLHVLKEGVIEGRNVFGNIVKYVRMAASSNFGNMFSVVGVSAFLPFVPMLPIQILLNNLLYDLSQSAIPSDSVDPEWITHPRRWDINNLLRFIVVIGPISSLFDYSTFLILVTLFHAGNQPEFFHTAWFIESIFSQILVIHVIRTTKIPFLQSMASWQLSLASLAVLAVAAWLPVSPLASTLGFVPLTIEYWGVLAILLLLYIPLTQVIKSWYVRHYGI